MEFRASTCKRKFVKIKSRAFVITTYELEGIAPLRP